MQSYPYLTCTIDICELKQTPRAETTAQTPCTTPLGSYRPEHFRFVVFPGKDKPVILMHENNTVTKC